MDNKEALSSGADEVNSAKSLLKEKSTKRPSRIEEIICVVDRLAWLSLLANFILIFISVPIHTPINPKIPVAITLVVFISSILFPLLSVILSIVAIKHLWGQGADIP